jgi:hypothetical protein
MIHRLINSSQLTSVQGTLAHSSVDLTSLSIICIIRVFLFVRNLDYLFSSIQVTLFFETIRRVMSSLSSLLVTFACITYLFALVGVHLFGGLVNKDPDRSQYELLQETAYGANDYYSLNFNSIPSAMITLICLLRVSGWDTFAMGMVKVTDSSARLFFILWYLIGVLLLMNIVATLFISGFVVETATHQQQNHLSLEAETTMEEEGAAPPLTGAGAGDNQLSQALLTSSEEMSEMKRKDSSLQQLASRLTQFMSPALPLPPPSVPGTDQHSPGAGYRPPTVAKDSGEDGGAWNQDISRLTKGSAIRDITTAREGGKLYLISMPQYGPRGGNISVDSMGQDEQEVGKKFMERIHSLYATEERG